MCRIAGLWDQRKNSQTIDEIVLNRMRDSLSYGGPDAANSYIDRHANLGLGHARLAIIDLSPDANQPFRIKNLHLVFNGEIYNYVEVRSELLQLGYSFNTNSDTEVFVDAWKQWGVECLHKFRGMFAFALWDDEKEELIIGRDRVGVKPMYWYLKDGLFMFASELKAFHEHHEFDKTINHASIPGFLKHGYIKAPLSIYKFAHKLEPGSVLKLSNSGNIEKIKYWDIHKIYTNTTINNETDSILIDQCEKILQESFNLRMVSDVPVGIFLSGGIDSSLVTALLQKDSAKSLKTFTIGFNEPEYNEAEYAKKISKHLGTEHYELYCGEKEFIDVLQDYFYIYDEPFGDNSGIPTFLVSQLAKQHVKVTLSADGGDEIFSGYVRYSANHQYYKKIERIPGRIRDLASGVLTAMGHDRTMQLFKAFPWTSGIDSLEWRMSKMLNAVKARDPIEFQELISSYISDKVLFELLGSKGDSAAYKNGWPIRDHLMYSLLGAIDITTYLEGDILAKVDRATMQNSIEGREPFLDQHIIEFALGLPDDVKMKNGETKWILRQILYKYVPKSLLERPKQGFAIPTKKWLNTILYHELDSIYQDDQFTECFHLNSAALKTIIKNFKSNAKKQENPYLVWFLYCLYGWYKRWC
ncbi:MAG: asparagine synthase (glutamine-hydrolyzing) [Saprospiraceae bacterium]